MKKLFLTALVFFAMSPFFNVSAQTPLPLPQEEVHWNYIIFLSGCKEKTTRFSTKGQKYERS